MGEAKVKSYKRRTKSGKTVRVRAYSRSCKGGCATTAGSGIEYSDRAKKEYTKAYLNQASKYGLSEGDLEKMREYSTGRLSAGLDTTRGTKKADRHYSATKKKEAKFYSHLSDAHKKFYKKWHGYSED